MKKEILIAALACASGAAFAQSSNTNGQSSTTAKDAHPREVASGQASGKIVSQPAGSNASLNSSSKVTAPKDVATGQASGKRQYQPVTFQKVTEEDAATKAPQTNNGQTNRESSAPSVSEVVVTKPNGNKTAQDDWTNSAKANGGSTSQSPRVATGDVNGDGRPDVAINNSHSNIKDSKDHSTGQMTGKRQHDPLTIKKEVDASSPAK